jgi:hypothetical protein
MTVSVYLPFLVFVLMATPLMAFFLGKRIERIAWSKLIQEERLLTPDQRGKAAP